MIECLRCEKKGDPYDNWYCEECGNTFINQQINNKKFIEKLHIAWRKVIDLNLKRNMNGESHIEYNDIFDKLIEELERR